MPLKLILLIGSFKWRGNTGRGGHYYSALTISKELAKLHQIEIVNIGDFYAPALDQSNVSVNYVDLTFKSKIKLDRQPLLRALKSKNPDVVIAFDKPSAIISRRLCVELSIGFLVVKPGGKWSACYPNNAFQIHFSPQDAQKAIQRSHYGKHNIACIPNRVSIPKQDWSAIKQLRNELEIQSNDLILICISRIDEAYRKKFESAIKLSHFLRKKGYPARLIIVGFCKSKELFEDINKSISKLDAVLTSEKYTKNASRLLKIAPINVGAGRGFMEGCALGQYMLAINNREALPVSVSEENFSYFFEENFSMRVEFPINHEKNKKKILEIANKCLKGEIEDKFSKNCFNQFFSTEEIIPLYTNVLELAKKSPEKWNIDILVDEYHFIKFIIRFLKFKVKNIYYNKIKNQY